ncbi:MAG: glycine--tRNA ligase [Chthoniobacter sp.]|nr:glycine--tRNA ligase [Chthoniobacter sp.]
MSQPKETPLMEKIVSLCKRRGFIFQSSEIYGGINGFWDYGPLGAELKRNLRDTWWRAMTRDREDVVGLDATIIMHPGIWKASGHVDTFSDPMADCLVTKKRFRADHVEPQSGTVYTFGGAAGAATLEATAKAFLEIENTSVSEFFIKHTFGMSPELRAALKTKAGGAEMSDADLAFHLTTPQFKESAFETLVEGMPRIIMSAQYQDRLVPVLLESSDAVLESFSVLLPAGKPPESARKIAQQYYAARGLTNPTLLGETTAKVENSRAFNPENGAQLTEPKPFNLMFHTFVGATASDDDKAYLRPETAQAIFAQFKNVVDSSRQKVPFGICQIGKAFRNEVTPRNFTFRSREFEQMELEFFIAPDEAIRILHGAVATWSEGADLSTPQPNWGWEMWHHYWEKQRVAYYDGIGLGADLLDYHRQKPDELAHYARACVDILFKFPFGTEELEGIAARSDFDLSQHQKHSGKSQEIFDEELRAAAGKLDDAAKNVFVASVQDEWASRAAKNGKPEDAARAAAQEFCEKLFKGQYVPHVIEPSAGLDRLALAILAAAYHEEEKADVNGKIEKRTVLRFHPRVAPVKVGVFPLLKNKPELVAKARAVYEMLKRQMNCFYDETGNIGRRYARQDEAGTPFGVTIDFDTIGENGPELLDTVTLRHRDDGRQERVKIADLLGLLLPQVQ